MLTDGRNEHDDLRPLAGVLTAARGKFVCDAWGIGDGWDARAAARGGRRPARQGPLGPPGVGTRGRLRAVDTQPARQGGAGGDPHGGDWCPAAGCAEPQAGVPHRDAAGGRRPTARARTSPGPGATRHAATTSASPSTPKASCTARSCWPPRSARPRRRRPVSGLPEPQPLVVHWTDDPALSGRTDEQVLHSELYDRLGQAVADAATPTAAVSPTGPSDYLGTAVALAHRTGARRQLRRAATAGGDPGRRGRAWSCCAGTSSRSTSST